MSENDHHVVLVEEDDPETIGKKRKRPVLHGGPRPGTVRVRATRESVEHNRVEREELARMRADLEAEKKKLEKRAKALEKIEKQRARPTADEDEDDHEDGSDN